MNLPTIYVIENRPDNVTHVKDCIANWEAHIGDLQRGLFRVSTPGHRQLLLDYAKAPPPMVSVLNGSVSSINELIEYLSLNGPTDDGKAVLLLDYSLKDEDDTEFNRSALAAIVTHYQPSHERVIVVSSRYGEPLHELISLGLEDFTEFGQTLDTEQQSAGNIFKGLGKWLEFNANFYPQQGRSEINNAFAFIHRAWIEKWDVPFRPIHFHHDSLHDTQGDRTWQTAQEVHSVYGVTDPEERKAIFMMGDDARYERTAGRSVTAQTLQIMLNRFGLDSVEVDNKLLNVRLPSAPGLAFIISLHECICGLSNESTGGTRRPKPTRVRLLRCSTKHRYELRITLDSAENARNLADKCNNGKRSGSSGAILSLLRAHTQDLIQKWPDWAPLFHVLPAAPQVARVEPDGRDVVVYWS